MAEPMSPRQQAEFWKLLGAAESTAKLMREGPEWKAGAAKERTELDPEPMHRFGIEISYLRDRLDSLKNQILKESDPAIEGLNSRSE